MLSSPEIIFRLILLLLMLILIRLLLILIILLVMLIWLLLMILLVRLILLSNLAVHNDSNIASPFSFVLCLNLSCIFDYQW